MMDDDDAYEDVDFKSDRIASFDHDHDSGMKNDDAHMDEPRSSNLDSSENHKSEYSTEVFDLHEESLLNDDTTIDNEVKLSSHDDTNKIATVEVENVVESDDDPSTEQNIRISSATNLQLGHDGTLEDLSANVSRSSSRASLSARSSIDGNDIVNTFSTNDELKSALSQLFSLAIARVKLSTNAIISPDDLRPGPYSMLSAISEWYSKLRSATLEDLNIEIPIVVEYICYIVSSRVSDLEACSAMFYELILVCKSIFSKAKDAESADQSKSLLIRIFGDLYLRFATILNSVTPCLKVADQQRTNLRKTADLIFQELIEIAKLGETVVFDLNFGLCFAAISRHDLCITLELFQNQMKKIYFHGSAMEFVPLMKICAHHVKYTVRLPVAASAAKEFVEVIDSLLKTTNCPELIDATFECVVATLSQISVESAEHKLAQQSIAAVQNRFDESCEGIFNAAHAYCTKGKYIATALQCMEAIVQFSTLTKSTSSFLATQHERLCTQILRRVEMPTMRIFGLDHLGRYIKIMNPDSLDSDWILTKFSKLPGILFQPAAIPRDQEAALITTIVTELGNRVYLRDCFQQVIHKGIDGEKATGAQRAVCLNSMGIIASKFANGSPEKLKFVEDFSKYPARYASRLSPAIVVMAVLKTLPYLGMENQSVIDFCIDIVFGYDTTLIEEACDAIIRIAKLGSRMMTTVMQKLLDSTYTDFICISPGAAGFLREVPFLLQRIQTLGRLLDTVVSLTGPTIETHTIDLCAVMLLVGTFPHPDVSNLAKGILDRTIRICDFADLELKIQLRANDKLTAGFANKNMEESQCGSAEVLQYIEKRSSRKPGHEIPELSTWWQNQCEFLCFFECESSSKALFVKSLASEFVKQKNPAFRQLARAALVRLRNSYDAAIAQIKNLLRENESNLSDPTLIQLLDCFSESPNHALFREYFQIIVKSWLDAEDEVVWKSSNAWDETTMESACKLIDIYIDITEHMEPRDRDRIMILYRELTRGRERRFGAKYVGQGFLKILQGGKMESAESFAFTFRALSAFTPLREIQSSALSALLFNNPEQVLCHFVETVLRSFNPSKWESSSGASLLTAAVDQRFEFVVNLANALFLLLDSKPVLTKENDVLLLGLVFCLLSHPTDQIRAQALHFCQRSGYFGEMTHHQKVTIFSKKLDMYRLSLNRATFLKEGNFKAIHLVDVIEMIKHILEYIREPQYRLIVNLLVPWLGEVPMIPMDEIPKVIRELMDISLRIARPQDYYRIWHALDLVHSFDSVMEVFVTVLMHPKSGNAEFRVITNALEQIVGRANKHGQYFNTFNSLARCLPSPSWHRRTSIESDVIPNSDRNELSATRVVQMRAIFSIMAKVPNLMAQYSPELLVEVLYCLFVEDTVDTPNNSVALAAILSDCDPQSPPLPEGYPSMNSIPEEVLHELAFRWLDCTLRCPSKRERDRALKLLPIYNIKLHDEARVNTIIYEIVEVCCCEFEILQGQFSFHTDAVVSRRMLDALLIVQYLLDACAGFERLMRRLIEILICFLMVPVSPSTNNTDDLRTTAMKILEDLHRLGMPTMKIWRNRFGMEICLPNHAIARKLLPILAIHTSDNFEPVLLYAGMYLCHKSVSQLAGVSATSREQEMSSMRELVRASAWSKLSSKTAKWAVRMCDAMLVECGPWSANFMEDTAGRFEWIHEEFVKQMLKNEPIEYTMKLISFLFSSLPLSEMRWQEWCLKTLVCFLSHEEVALRCVTEGLIDNTLVKSLFAVVHGTSIRPKLLFDIMNAVKFENISGLVFVDAKNTNELTNRDIFHRRLDRCIELLRSDRPFE